MIFQPDALRRLTQFLEEHNVPYMVIGGIANAVWGEVRATADADLKVLPGNRSIPELRKLIEAEFPRYRRPGLEQAESSLIVSVEVAPGMVSDLLMGVFPYEEQAVRRGVRIEYEGTAMTFCTAEDLIIHKAIADRDKDWNDIEGIVWRQKKRLDIAYVRHWLRQWAEELEKPQMVSRFESLLKGS